MPQTAWPDGYWRDARWLALVLGALLFVAFSPFLVGGKTLLTSAADAPSLYAEGAVAVRLPDQPLKEVDPGAPAWQSEPWLAIEHNALFVDHRLPWWDPYDGYGAPFAAAQQPQPFYPLTMLAAVHPSPRVWDIYVVARLFVAAFFAALFVRFYGRRYASLASGLATAFSGYYVLYYSMPHLSVETLLPAVLWATEWVVRRPGYASMAGLGAVVGAIHLGGMPESSAVALLAAGAYLLVRIPMASRSGFPYQRIVTFAAANAIGAAIGGMMLVPFAEFLPNAADTHRNAAIIVGAGWDPIPLSRALFQRLAPLSYGPPLNAITDISGHAGAWLRGWFGAVTAFCAVTAVLGVFRSERGNDDSRGPVIALAALATCALGKSLGAAWITWIGVLPVLRLIGFTKYGEVVTDVCVALLCGLGIAAFENSRWPERWIVPSAAAIVAFVLTFGFVEALRAIPVVADTHYLYGAAALALILVGAAFVTATRRRAVAFVPLCLAALVGVDVVGNYFAPMFWHIASQVPASRNPYAGAPYLEAIRQRSPGGTRIAGLGGPLWPDWAGAMRLDSPESLNGMYPNRFLPFARAFLVPRNPDSRDLLDRFDATGNPSFTTAAAQRWMTLSSVGYVVVPAGLVISGRHLSRFFAGDAWVYAYDDALPRASVFHEARWIPDADDALAALANPRTDVKRTLILSGTPDPGPAPASPGPGPEESAAIVHRDAATIEIHADLRSAGFVMLNDTYFPGWVATIDGAPTEILNADYLFRAVRVGAGRHVIRYAYQPRSALVGMLMSAFGILCAAGCGILGARRSARAVPG